MLERSVREQLTSWFGNEARQWRCLRIYRIPHALPDIVPRWSPTSGPGVPGHPHLFVCGDYTANASIQGAMIAGRYAADAAAKSL